MFRGQYFATRSGAVAIVASVFLACQPAPEAPADRLATATETETAAEGVLAVELVEVPAKPGSLAPNWSVDTGGALLLTWLEPDSAAQPTRHSLQKARFNGAEFGAAQELAAGSDFFANWADLPAVAIGGDGVPVAHWLEKLGEATYAYGAQLVAGPSWEPQGLLHDDASPTEHGFVSFVPIDDGIQAFWLDGRSMAGEPPGSMELRTARLEGGVPSASELLDPRVCECCATDATLTSLGPLVVYRDRSEREIRDISVVRATPAGWSEPATVATDGWQIEGCPVNGPAVAAAGAQVAVAWFTAAAEQPKVRIAFSKDAGQTFGAPFEVEAGRPLGRVDLVLDEQGVASLVWLETVADEAEIRLARFTAAGQAAPNRILVRTSAARRSGFPRLARLGDDLVLAWVEVGEPSYLRVAKVIA